MRLYDLGRVGSKILLLAVGCAITTAFHTPEGGLYTGILASMLCATSLSSLVEWRFPASCTRVFVYLLCISSLMWTTLLFTIPVIAIDAGRLAPTPQLWGMKHTDNRYAKRIAEVTVSSDTKPASTKSILHMLKDWAILAAPIVPIAAPLFSQALIQGAGAAFPDFLTTQITWYASEMIIFAILIVIGLGIGIVTNYYAKLWHAFHSETDLRSAERRAAYARISDAEAFRIQAVRSATLSERTRIARDIHDNVGHVLTRAIMQTQAAMTINTVQNDTANEQRLQEIASTLNEAMSTIRASVHDMDDDGTDFTSMITAAAQGLPEQRFTVTLDNGISQAPAAITRCFSAVIREALTNAERHGNASHIRIALRDMPALWQLVIQDNGNASHPSNRQGMATANKRGMGLEDIAQRAQALGGTSLCGFNDTGWRVFVSIPKRAK